MKIKVHSDKIKVRAIRRKHFPMNVHAYKAAQVDKQFEASFKECPDVLLRMAQEALHNLNAGLSDDLDPDRM